MGIFELFLIAVGLSMDAFAVAVCRGLSMKKLNLKQGAVVALFFGGFQGLMPLIGWVLGKQFEQYIVSIDHWIAFVLLAIIGGNMIKESFDKCDECKDSSLGFKTMLIMAIATSIDALAVGVSFAFTDFNPDWFVYIAFIMIAVIACVLSAFGVKLGNIFGTKYKSKAEFAGGLILILLGLKILLEGVGILNL